MDGGGRGGGELSRCGREREKEVSEWMRGHGRCVDVRVRGEARQEGEGVATYLLDGRDVVHTKALQRVLQALVIRGGGLVHHLLLPPGRALAAGACTALQQTNENEGRGGGRDRYEGGELRWSHRGEGAGDGRAVPPPPNTGERDTRRSPRRRSCAAYSPK